MAKKNQDFQAGGRLAMRVEGSFWNAYYAMPNTMEGALLLGSIHIAAVEDEERKMAFMGVMMEFVGDVLRGLTGMEDVRWSPPVDAPEAERSGNA
jgi:hypothetical protein